MDLLSAFKNYLFSQDKKPSLVTVKNYLSDINHFVKWFEEKYSKLFNPSEVTKNILESYKLEMSDIFSASSLERHLSSLRKFFYFLKLEGQISIDPFKPLISEASTPKDPWHLKDFKSFLYVYNASHLTIKNYLIDIKQFMTWAQEVTGVNTTSEANVLTLLTPKLVEEYKQRLLSQGTFSPATINRKLSSLRKYTLWAAEEGLLKQSDLITPNVAIEKPRIRSLEAQTPLFTQIPALERQSKVKPYSRFAPFRLFQKVSKAFTIALDSTVVSPLAMGVEKAEYVLWQAKGRPIFEKAKALRIPKQITHEDILGIKNISKEFYAPLELSTQGFSRSKKLWFKLRYYRPDWYKRYHSYAIVHYFHFAVLVIFVVALSLGFYNGFLKAANQSPILAAAPTAPPRVLSFQGRLTDNNDNQITSPTNLRFAIYDTLSSTGSSLLWQEVDQVAPDSDGIFNVILGNGSAIPQSLFANNSALWLGVTVESTSELTPRQPLATVAYATNAEVLQGMPPTTQAGITSYKNVILALDSSGNFNLSDSSPTDHAFQVGNGTFKISGQPLLLTTNVGSNGNVQIAPDGSGRIDLTKPLVNTSKSNNIASAVGTVEVDDGLSVLASASGQSAFTINATGANSPLISASASGVAKFTVDNSGNVDSAGTSSISSSLTFKTGAASIQTTADNNLTLGGNTTGQVVLSGFNGAVNGITFSGYNTCTLKTSASGVVNCGVDNGGTNWWNQLGGVLSPVDVGYDFAIGGSSTASALFSFTGVKNALHQTIASISGSLIVMPNNGYGQVGIGTTNPLSTLDVNGGVAIGSYAGTNTVASGELAVSGAIGIGTNSPAELLHIKGASPLIDIEQTAAGTNAWKLGYSAGNKNLILQPTTESYFFIRAAAGTFAFGFDTNTLDTGLGLIPTSTDRLAIQAATSDTTKSALNVMNSNSNTLLYVRNDGNIGIGTTAPTALLHINGGYSNNAALIVNNLNSGDLFTASAGGTTRFTVKNNGNLQASAYATCTLKTDSTGLFTCGVDNGGVNWWNELGGVLSPINITDDFAIGGTATSSAEFSFTGVKTGQTQASVSGQLIVMPNNGYGGKVGIGTTSPTALLDVAGTASVGGQLTFRSGTAQIQSTVNQLLTLGGNTTGTIALMPNNGIGYVGIGTTTPLAKLQVGNSYSGYDGSTETMGGDFRIAGFSGGDPTAYVQARDASGSNNIALAFRVQNAGTVGEAMRILAGGNVGIATTTPTALLDVAGTASVGGQLTFRSGSGTIQTTADQLLTLGGNTTGNISLMAYNGGGYVGIGTTTPANKLDIIGNSSLTNGGRNIFGDDGNFNPTFKQYRWNGVGSSYYPFNLMTQGDASGRTLVSFQLGAATTIGAETLTDILTLRQLGFVGINNSSPTVALDVIGAASATGSLTFKTGAASIQSTADNNLTLGGNTTGQVILSGFNGAVNGITMSGYNTCTLKTSATGVINCGVDNGGTNWWNELAGALSPVNTNDDFLIGSTATSTAEFSFTGLGLANHQTQASFSGQLIVMPNNGYSGRLGIGTTNPLTKLQINTQTSTSLANPLAESLGATFGSGTIGKNLKLKLYDTGGSTDEYGFGVSASLFEITAGAGSDFAFFADATTTPTELLRIKSNGNVGIGTTAPTALLHVNGGYSNNAALIVNNLNSGDLFTASASGATKLTINNNGNLTFNQASTIQTNTGALTLSPAANIIFGSISQFNNTVSSDITPTTDNSYNLGNSTHAWASLYTYLVQSNGANNLELLAGSTGKLQIDSQVTTPLNTNLTLAPNGTGVIQVNSNILPSATGTLDLGSTTGPKYFRNIYGTTYYSGGTIGVTASLGCVSSTLGIVTGSGSCPGGVNWWNELGGALSPVNTNDDLLIGSTSTSSAEFAFTGLGLTTHQTQASISGNLIVVPNTGYGGHVGIGKTNPTNTLDLASLNSNEVVKIQLTEGTGTNGAYVGLKGAAGTNDVIQLQGDSNISALRFGLTNGTGLDTRIWRTGVGTLQIDPNGATNNVALNVVGQGAGSTSTISLYRSTDTFAQIAFSAANGSPQVVFGSGASGADTRFYRSAANTLIFDNNAAGPLYVGIGVPTSATLSTLDIRGASGTLSVASASGKTSFAALVANNDGVGDLFTASSSGVNKFNITRSGAIGLAGGYGSNGQCLLSSGATTIPSSWGSCGTGVNWWNELGGVLSPVNINDDFAIGGTSTSSAEFSFTGVKTGQTIASVSGNLIVMANNGYGGNFGLGTTTPALVSGANRYLTMSSPNGLPSIELASALAGVGNTTGRIDFINSSTNPVGQGARISSAIDTNASKTYNYDLIFSTNGSTTDVTALSERMRVLYNGTVGIGITAPQGLLHINGGYSNNAALIVNNLNSGDLFTASASGTPKFKIDNNGYVYGGNIVASPINGSSGGSVYLGVGIGGNTFGSTYNKQDFNVSGNVYIGYQAGYKDNGSAGPNIYIGYQAGYNDTGNNSQNTFIGYQAGFTTNGNFPNTFVGYQAGKLSTCSGNTFVGNQAGQSSTRCNNLALGEYAAQSLTIGANNSFTGYTSGGNTTTGSNNAFFGYQAGLNNTVGGLNTFLGSNANLGTGLGNLINATAIGANSYVTQNNSLILGSINGVNSATASAIIGIGTTAPTASLDLQGGNWGGNSALIINQLGSNTNAILTASSSGATKFTISNAGAIGLAGGYGSSNQCLLSSGSSTSPSIWGTCGAGTNWWNQLGGVLSPVDVGYDLAIGGNSTASALFSFTGVKNTLHQTIASISGQLVVAPNNGYGGNIVPAIDNKQNLGATSSARWKSLFLGPGSLHIQCQTTDAGCPASQNIDYQMAIDSTGTLGIGANVGSTNPADIFLTQGGNVGIGTAAPKENLTVGNGTTESSMGFKSSTNNALFFSTYLDTAYLSINRKSSDGSFANAGEAAASIGFSSGNGDGHIEFFTSSTNNTNPTARLGIYNSGNVGIGTTGPIAKFQVDGAPGVNVAGNALAIFNQTGSGDVISASSSGTTQFKLTTGGSIYSRSLYDLDNPAYFLDPAATGTSLATAGSVGIETATPAASLTVFNNATSGTLSTITQNSANWGMAISSPYLASAYVPGIEWYSQDYTPTKPKAGIFTMMDSTGSHMYFGTSNSYATGITNQALTIDPIGNVGIGTTNPTGIFSVGSNNEWYISNSAKNTLNTAGSTNGLADGWINWHGYADGTTQFRNFNIGNGKGTALVFVEGSTGNVGIGNGQTAPGYMLNVNGTLNATGTYYGNGKTMFETGDTWLRINQGSSFSSGVWFGTSNVFTGANLAAGSNGGSTNSRIYIAGGTYNGTNVINLDGSTGNGYFAGDVGIGTSPTTATLTVAGAMTQSGGNFSFQDAGVADSTAVRAFATGGNLYLQSGSGNHVYIRGTTAGIYADFNTSSNDLWVGLSTGLRMDLTGNDLIFNRNQVSYVTNSNTGSSTAVQVKANATTCTLTTGVAAWSCSSDQRLKKDITQLAPELQKVLSIRGVNFRWIDPTTPQDLQIGFIAQEIEPIFPELVHTDSLTGLKSVNYAGFTPILVEAIKEQQAEIASNSSVLARAANTFVDSTGNLNFSDETIATDSAFTVPHYFTLTDALGNPLNGIGAFAESAVANLRAGFISATQISTQALSVATENFTINGQNIRNYIAGIVTDIINSTSNNIVSPIASVDQLHANLISPIATSSAIAIKLENSQLSILNSQFATGSAVASIDNQGNATFSGSLNVGNDATISGTIRAKKIIADQIEGLNIQASTISAQYITNNVTNIYNSTVSSFPTFTATPANSSTISGLFANVFTDQNYINISSYSSQLAYIDNLNAATATFSNGLTVFGATTLTDTSIVGQLSVNGSLILADNSINVLGSDLNLQPLRQGGLSIMGGLIYVDTNGNIKFGADATVNGTLYAGKIAPTNGNDLTLNLASSAGNLTPSLKVNSANGANILGLSQAGDLIASGEATFSKLNLSTLVAPALAVSSTEVVATGSAGTGLISSHQKEMTIDNNLVTDKSLIYITPTTATSQPLFLLRQVPGKSFTVGIQFPDVTPIQFNWIIVN